MKRLIVRIQEVFYNDAEEILVEFVCESIFSWRFFVFVKDASTSFSSSEDQSFRKDSCSSTFNGEMFRPSIKPSIF